MRRTLSADYLAFERVNREYTVEPVPSAPATGSGAATLAGGVYEVQRNAGAASYLEVPMTRPSAFRGCTICG